jgi:ATP-dependent RNA helicase DHX57
MVLRDLLPKHPNLRVILMSATMNAQLFSAYFGGAPIFTIPGRTFPVQAFFLEHALELTGHKVTAGADWARSRPGGKGGVLTDASRDQERVLKNAPISERDDELLQLSELRQRYHVPEPSANEFEMPAAAKPSGERFSESTVQALYALDHTSIDLALIVDLVVWFVQQRQQNLRQAGIASTSSAPPLPIDSSLDATDLFWGDDEPTLQSGQPAKLTAKSKAAAPIAAPNPVVENIVQHARGLDGSILIFMPGMKEISNLYDLLLACPAISQLHPNQNKWIFPLHSTLSSEEQLRVFASPPRPERVGPSFRFAQKIVIATNIAETSITIDDCVCVIDAARMKETRFDPTKKMASLDECFVSRANAMQRYYQQVSDFLRTFCIIFFVLTVADVLVVWHPVSPFIWSQRIDFNDCPNSNCPKCIEYRWSKRACESRYWAIQARWSTCLAM